MVKPIRHSMQLSITEPGLAIGEGRRAAAKNKNPPLTVSGRLATIRMLRKGYRKPGQTINDIARLAGVSPATVSKALNNTDRVSAETRERVRAIAKKFNWHANQQARGLVLKRSHLIGLVVSSITNNFCAQLYDGAERHASERGYNLLLCVTEDDPQVEVSALRRLTEAAHVDGILAIPAPVEEQKSPFYELHHADWPYVLVARKFLSLTSDYVVCDDALGGRIATEHLIGLGHRRIAYAFDAAQSPCTNVIDRRTGYRQALEAAGLPYEACLSASVSLRASPEDQASLKNMVEAQKPTAIFAHNDRTAMAVLDWLRWAGLEVPGQMAVVGFGNLNLARIVTPPLTSIEYGISTIGKLAAQILIDRIEGVTTDRRQVVVTPSLVVRQSSGGHECGA
jgi:DNA-binding LacI/PurR family transcriptional regulator